MNEILIGLSSYPKNAEFFGVIGTSSWIVPDGVYSISAVCIGGGGGMYWDSGYPTSNGGCGGGLSWTNDIPVTPGETLSIIVGAGGTSVRGNTAGKGGTSGIQRSGVWLVTASGGNGGFAAGYNTATIGNGGPSYAACNQGGGQGGNRASYNGNPPAGGAGGCAGYLGNGGSGPQSSSTSVPSTPGSGGGGGGGSFMNATHGGDGGGTMLYGVGANGLGRTYNQGTGGIGSADLVAGQNTTIAENYTMFGAGAGGTTSYQGAVRIIYNGGSFPYRAIVH